MVGMYRERKTRWKSAIESKYCELVLNAYFTIFLFFLSFFLFFK